MRIKILTLFPEMFQALNHSIIKRAQEQEKVIIEAIDLREFSRHKHKKCDDYPYGGGAGMVMSVQPIHDAIMHHDKEHSFHRVYLSPKGKKLDMQLVKRLATKPNVLLLCGHYEGVDQRALDMCIDEEISIGDYILTGGELAAMVLIDSTSRYIDSVISNESLSDESFNNNLLEYPQYTRPQNFMGQTVPDVLVSGNHHEIDKWRIEQSIQITKKYRPDLISRKENK